MDKKKEGQGCPSVGGAREMVVVETKHFLSYTRYQLNVPFTNLNLTPLLRSLPLYGMATENEQLQIFKTLIPKSTVGVCGEVYM